ncbi:hypothetical protein M2105_003763 [Paenibacillus sp. PastF-1]|nr:hypothetical protein [Paenibacillus sp. PastF-2]MDF9849395.1 hypothetical protein [Paenibacillus sp. PastM-2]MDF9855897.1 hypothetical protein [Paenibacillus sp. PastF-1]MDH6481237.1 hypothetical protein [Paenibacillus sp. PastH-2]MDH6508656.1 hypothetical protein [Paenibacillus sp. PastM-3]
MRISLRQHKQKDGLPQETILLFIINYSLSISSNVSGVSRLPT